MLKHILCLYKYFMTEQGRTKIKCPETWKNNQLTHLFLFIIKEISGLVRKKAFTRLA